MGRGLKVFLFQRRLNACVYFGDQYFQREVFAIFCSKKGKDLFFVATNFSEVGILPSFAPAKQSSDPLYLMQNTLTCIKTIDHFYFYQAMALGQCLLAYINHKGIFVVI